MKCSYYISYLLFWVIIQRGKTLFHHSTRSCYSNSVVHLWRNIKKSVSRLQSNLVSIDLTMYLFRIFCFLTLFYSIATHSPGAAVFFMNLVTLVEVLLLFTHIQRCPTEVAKVLSYHNFLNRSDQNQDARITTAKSPPIFFLNSYFQKMGKVAS